MSTFSDGFALVNPEFHSSMVIIQSLRAARKSTKLWSFDLAQDFCFLCHRSKLLSLFSSWKFPQLGWLLTRLWKLTFRVFISRKILLIFFLLYNYHASVSLISLCWPWMWTDVGRSISRVNFNRLCTKSRCQRWEARVKLAFQWSHSHVKHWSAASSWAARIGSWPSTQRFTWGWNNTRLVFSDMLPVG